MAKAWIEMIHRYFAMAIGVLIIAHDGDRVDGAAEARARRMCRRGCRRRCCC